MNNTIPTNIFALGGLNEIGKNTYVVEHDDEIIVIDAGIKFANASSPGISGIIANYDYLIENENKVKCLIITHGHEDHIGGVPYLIKQLNIKKIYTPLLAWKLIDRHLKEHYDLPDLPEIIIYDKETVIKTKNFEVDFCQVCHSIPDAFSVAVKTPNGNIFSTGDFRFDFVTKTTQTDLNKLSEISGRGLDVLLCESTSSEVQGFSSSEKVIIENIRELMLKSKDRIFLSTFASNIGRVSEIIKIANELNRKICVLGKSMQHNTKVCSGIGYLDDSNFIPVTEIGNYKNEEILVILTGSQGEEMAALSTLSRGQHSKMSLKPTDTVILSSNPIPGNFIAVENLINNLYKKGIKVIENNPNKPIHSSGHATSAEQQLLIQMLKPNFIFPIHGEYKMLKTMESNALDLGFKKENILITKNGNKLQLLNKKLTYTDHNVEVNPIFIDGSSVNRNSPKTMKERNVLSTDGIINISIIVNDKKVLFPNINNRGIFFAKASTALMSRMSSKIMSITSENIPKDNTPIDIVKINREVKLFVENIIWKWKHKNPIVKIDVLLNGKIN